MHTCRYLIAKCARSTFSTHLITPHPYHISAQSGCLLGQVLGLHTTSILVQSTFPASLERRSHIFAAIQPTPGVCLSTACSKPPAAESYAHASVLHCVRCPALYYRTVGTVPRSACLTIGRGPASRMRT